MDNPNTANSKRQLFLLRGSIESRNKQIFDSDFYSHPKTTGTISYLNLPRIDKIG